MPDRLLASLLVHSSWNLACRPVCLRAALQTRTLPRHPHLRCTLHSVQIRPALPGGAVQLWGGAGGAALAHCRLRGGAAGDPGGACAGKLLLPYHCLACIEAVRVCAAVSAVQLATAGTARHASVDNRQGTRCSQLSIGCRPVSKLSLPAGLRIQQGRGLRGQLGIKPEGDQLVTVAPWRTRHEGSSLHRYASSPAWRASKPVAARLAVLWCAWWRNTCLPLRSVCNHCPGGEVMCCADHAPQACLAAGKASMAAHAPPPGSQAVDRPKLWLPCFTPARSVSFSDCEWPGMSAGMPWPYGTSLRRSH